MKVDYVEIGNSNLKIADGNYSSKYPRSEEFTSSGIPFIRANNLENKTVIDDDMYFISEEKHAELKKGHLEPRDVLITTRGNIGQVALVPEKHNDSNINSQIVLLRCREGWHPEYLLHAFTSDFVSRQIPAFTTGTALKQLPVKNLKKLKIPLPPLDQQKKIAAILDAADAYRQKTKTLIEKYDELTQSLFLEMFGDPVTNPKGWEWQNLKDISDYFIGLTYKPENVAEDGIIVLRSSNIQDGELAFKDVVRVDKEVKPKLIVKDKDILMCSRNGSARLVGKVALIRNLREAMTFGAFMTIIRSDQYNYLLNYFRTLGFRRQIATGATSTVNQITKKMLDRIVLPKPPNKLQNKFAERVQLIEAQKAQAQASLVQSEDLFNSLIQRAFKGELV